MIEIFQKQYALVLQARQVMLNFIETAVSEDFMRPVPGYNKQTIQRLLVHNADCYLYWLEYIALELPVKWLKYEEYNTMASIRMLYKREDDSMAAFLQQFENSMNVPVNNPRSQSEKLNTTPLMIFTHVITHEFHHKGQITSMCRQLGYPPPETDVYQFFFI